MLLTFSDCKRQQEQKEVFSVETSSSAPSAQGYPADCLTAAPAKKGSAGLMAVLDDLKGLSQPK